MAEASDASPILLENPSLATHSFRQIQKDLFAGSMAGLVVVLSGHPLDTIKVRMQMLNTGFFSTVKNMIKNEGVRSLYKGVKSPLYSTPVLSSLTFAAYEFGLRFQGLKRGDQRSTLAACLSGVWSGFIFGLAVTPIDLVKSRLQMEGVGSHTKSSSLTSMVKKLVKEKGILGLYKGLGITLVRDIPSFAFQFAIFEKVKEFVRIRFGDSSLSSFIAGGASLLTVWALGHPIDTLKTRIQCAETKMGIVECSKEIYRTSGVKGFFKGLQPCLLRALVTGSMRFIVFDKCLELAGGKPVSKI